jgi:hypothetical protein
MTSPHPISIERHQHIVADGWDMVEESSKEFWTIRGKDVIITDRANPFTASDPEIVVYQCGLCGNCSPPDVIARRVGDTVVWIEIPDRIVTETPLPFRMNVVNVEDYERAIGAGLVSALPAVAASELRTFLNCVEWPNPNLGLYRTPLRGDDDRGQVLLAELQRAFQVGIESAVPCQAPDTIVEWQIGLDLPGCPECQVRAGWIGDQVALFLNDYPCFRMWITSPEFVMGYLRSELRGK